MNISLTSTVPFVPARESRRQVAPFVPFNRISVRSGIWSILLGFGIITPLAVGIGCLHLPESAHAMATAQQRWVGYLNHPGALFLKAVLFYPLLEETIYRGMLLQLLRRYCPLWLSVLISAGAFGATHLGQGYANALNAFLLGGVFAGMVVRTGSLLPSMLCHVAINFSWLFLIVPGFGLLEFFLGLDPVRPIPVVNPLSFYPGWWLLTSVALATTAVVILRKSFPRSTTA
jgi:membrane protease YdiL (CAAX protease family)